MIDSPFHTLAEEASELCVRQTGKTVAEWETEWSRRRVHAFRQRMINGRRLYDEPGKLEEVRRLDLDGPDFETVLGIMAHQGDSIKIPAHLRGLPRAHIPGEDWDDTRRGLTDRAAEDSTQPPAKTVIRWRLTQECLRRIAKEAAELRVPA